MQKKKKFITGGLTILAAIATAHLMQRNASGDARLQPGSAPEPQQTARADGSPRADVPAVAPEVPAASRNSVSIVTAIPAPPAQVAETVEFPAVGTELQDRMAMLDPTAEQHEPGPASVPEQPRRNAFGLSCGLILTATPAPSAMADLTLTAPCRGGEPVTVRHGALAFTDRMDDLGRLQRSVPALASEAEFTVRFADGTVASTDVTVPDVSDVERVALQTSAKSGLEIHALELGAEYGAPGHVWRGAPRSPADAERVRGGFLTRLGDESQAEAEVVEVYTFPSGRGIEDGVVRLSIEAEVTARNCETEAKGQTLQRDASGAMIPVALTVAMPECSATGEYLVLKNLLRDLKIASN